MAKFVGWRAIMSRDASNTPTSHRFGGSISIYQPQSTGQFKSIIVEFPYCYCTAGERMHWIAVIMYSVFNGGMSRALADVLKSHQATS